jgi:murein DD-endopeptidase MepM/ murein hydrolase activator NlpD
MRTKIVSLLIALTFTASFFLPVKAQDQTSYPFYVVQSGDTLSSIADRFDTTQADLISQNGIADANTLAVGSPLTIPSLPGLSGQISILAVQPGETLKGLTLKYQITQDLLLKVNRITSPGEIQTGSALILPVVDESKQKVPISMISASQTLLEVAASTQTNPWNLLSQNDDSSDESIFAWDVLYFTPSQDTKEISPVDAKLTRVTISPLPLEQGKTFVIMVKAPQAVTLQGSLNGMPLNFFSNADNQQVALQGVNAEADPGSTPFTLNGTFADGSSFNFQQSVLLISGNYPEADPLTVDPTTIDPKVTQPEDDMIKNLVTPATSTRYWTGLFLNPTKNYDVATEITANYGERRSYNNGALKNFHTGVDFGGGVGLPITAPADGKVVYADGPLTVRGNTTIIDHGWGVYSAYFHQSEIDVKVGDTVKAGDIIGKVGNTGRVEDANAFVGAGAHLHWEIWVNGIQVDPLDWLSNQYP